MNQKQMETLTNICSYEYENMGSMIIVKDGKTIYEQYFHGCTKRSTLHIYSMTKSIVSILIGIAIDQGLITSLDQSVIDFFPEYEMKQKEHLARITIKDLLTMRVAYRYTDGPMIYIKYFMSKDWIKFTLKQLEGVEPAGGFRYAGLIGPDLLSGILTKVSGMSLLGYAQAYLFEPMNIHVAQPIVFHSAKEQKQFQKATDMSGWVMHPKGIHSGGWGLTLTVEDLAKIGTLLLHDGVWEGKRLVSSTWIKESTKEHNRWNEIDRGYGYLWWINDKEVSGFAAMGDGGNILYVNTKKHLVIASTSLFAKQAKDRIALIEEEIEPYII